LKITEIMKITQTAKGNEPNISQFT
jgi:hypothetical protein